MIDWKEDVLGSVIEIKYGKDHKKLLDGDIPCYGSGGLMRYVNEQLYDKESILIPRKGSLNNIMYQNKPFWTVDTMFWTKINDEIIFPKFLFYQLSLIDYTVLNVGSAVPSLTVPVIEEIDIKYPPLPEQKAIAEVLSSLDDKIDLLHRQNKTLEQMAETLFRQWFPPKGRTGVEEAKEDWEVGFLPDEFDFLMGQSPKGSSFNEDGIGTPMYQGNADFDFRFPKHRVYTTEAKRLAQKFDTLVSVRAPVGEQNMAIEECCIGRGVARFRYKNNPDYYTYTYFKFKYLMNEIKQFNNEGTVFGSISKGDFERLEINIPPVDIVKKFQNEVKAIDDKVIKNTYQIRTLEKLRDTLLPKLMSGDVKIKND
jgi:type I restriction enzyme, S subunit